MSEELWHEGANYTADAIVLADRRVLLIQRHDTGDWALPGGFVNKNEDPHKAARREALEETGYQINSDGTLVYQGKVDDPRTSPTRWIETSAYLFTQSNAPEVSGSDDAKDAAWIELDKLPVLYGSHQMLLRYALEAAKQ